MALKRTYGWIRQKPDSRDWKFKAPRHLLVSLPPFVDLSANMGPLLDQGSLGSCGPNTADECIEYDQKIEGLPVVSASRLFVYFTTRYLMDPSYVDQDTGVDNRTMLKALNGYGYCDESLWPYDVSKFTQKPPTACFTAALANRINNYAAVQQSLDQMQGCLAAGFPFIFGFSVYDQMESDACAQNGIVADPPAGAQPIGGHDVTICGYTTVQRPGVKPGNVWPANTFRFRNHWSNADGSPWGDGGYGYISFNYAIDPNQANDFWVINAVQGKTPPPPPPPPSPPPSPPPPPPGPSNLEQVIDGIVNDVFANLLAQYAGRPLIRKILKAAQSAIIAEIHKLFVQGGTFTTGMVEAIVGRVFDGLEKYFAADPNVVVVLEVLRPIVAAALTRLFSAKLGFK